MRGNRGHDTRPERQVRSDLHRRGLRFRKNIALDAGGFRIRPDIVFTRRRIVVFIDGCFWHGCPEHGKEPRANTSYWRAKLARNRERDLRTSSALRDEGWKVLRYWEHHPAGEIAAEIAVAVLNGETK